MIGIDTNVLVRYSVRDDPEQAALADRMIDSLTAENPGFVSLTVLVECWWVLGRAYAVPIDRRRAFVEALLMSQELRVQAPDAVRSALRMTQDGADFPDALITRTATDAGCDRVMTLDRRAARHSGMTLLRA